MWGKKQAHLKPAERTVVIRGLRKDRANRQCQAQLLQIIADSSRRRHGKNTLLSLVSELTCQAQLQREALAGLVMEMVIITSFWNIEDVLSNITKEEVEEARILSGHIRSGVLNLSKYEGGKDE